MSSPDPPWRPPPARRAPKPRLSQDLIVETGLKVLLAEGLGAVSMRGVAQALDTGPASLYVHVATKDELLELMLDRVLEEVPLPVPDPKSWRDQIKDLLRAQAQAMRRYPGIAQVAWQVMIPVGPNALRHAEALLTLLRAGGLSRTESAYAAEALSLYTKAFTYEATIWTTATDERETLARGKQLTEYLTSLPEGTFANMLASKDLFTADTAEARFEFALTMLLNGLPSS